MDSLSIITKNCTIYHNNMIAMNIIAIVGYFSVHKLHTVMHFPYIIILQLGKRYHYYIN